MVTSTGSGLAVPDWPLSFGRVMPEMQGGVLYEHGHRMIASAVGLLIVIQALWIQRTVRRGWLPRLAWIAVLGVILQGLLGGLTVLLRLPDPVSIAHAGLAQIVFALTVSIAVLASAEWRAARPAAASPGLVTLLAATAVLVWLQILLGAWVRHSGAGLAIPTFPLAYGHLVPPLGSFPVALHFAHRAGAVVVTLLVAVVLWRVARSHGSEGALMRPAALLAGLVIVQIALGGWTILSFKTPWIATAHLACGALVFATSVVLLLRAARRPRRAPSPVRMGAEPAAVGGRA